MSGIILNEISLGYERNNCFVSYIFLDDMFTDSALYFLFLDDIFADSAAPTKPKEKKKKTTATKQTTATATKDKGKSFDDIFDDPLGS